MYFICFIHSVFLDGFLEYLTIGSCKNELPFRSIVMHKHYVRCHVNECVSQILKTIVITKDIREREQIVSEWFRVGRLRKMSIAHSNTHMAYDYLLVIRSGNELYVKAVDKYIYMYVYVCACTRVCVGFRLQVERFGHRHHITLQAISVNEHEIFTNEQYNINRFYCF